MYYILIFKVHLIAYLLTIQPPSRSAFKFFKLYFVRSLIYNQAKQFYVNVTDSSCVKFESSNLIHQQIT